MSEKLTNYVAIRNEDATIKHHGIAGQKWGERNGPPYPLAYEAHSSLEKKGDYQFEYGGHERKNKPLKKLTGNKRQDYKMVKAAYEKAKYATAAQKEIQRQQDKVSKKSDKSKKAAQQEKELSELNKASKREAAKRQKELQELGSEFAKAYGSKKIDKMTTESLNSMSESKAKKYIYKHGKETTAALMLSGNDAWFYSGMIKKSRNKSEFESYKAQLKGDADGAEKHKDRAQAKNLALQGYVGYKAYESHKERRNGK